MINTLLNSQSDCEMLYLTFISQPALMSSEKLMGRIAPIIGAEKSEELFLNHFIELCKCKINSVRRVCAAIFPTLCYVLGTKITEENLLDLFFQLCTDTFWGVRKACAESVPLISLICGPECRRNRIAPIVLNLAKDNNTWVISATFKILGQFISSFAQPCITGLAYSYNGELVVTNPVDSDFRDHSDPQTLANYEHYLKMFSNTEGIVSANTATVNSENSTSNQATNICDDSITPKNIARTILENKTKLTEQITEYAWPKQKFFKNYVFKECSKYIDLDAGNNNVTDNSEKSNVDQSIGENNENLCFVSEILDDKSSNQILSDNSANNSGNDSNVLQLDTSGTKNNTIIKNFDQTLEIQNQEMQQGDQTTLVTDNSNKNSPAATSATSDDNNIFDNIIFVSGNSSLEDNLHRRRYRRNAYSFWRKNTPTDLQSIIKKAIHDAQDNVKPPLPPPPPHPLKLPSKPASFSTIGPTSTNNIQEQQSEKNTKISSDTPISSSTNDEILQFEDKQERQDRAKSEFSYLPVTNSIIEPVNPDSLSIILSFLSKNSTIRNNNNNNTGNNNSSNSNDDPILDNSFLNSSNITDLSFNNKSTTILNLSDKTDKNGNEEDEVFNEYNSYKFWHISPEMPLDSKIVEGNGDSWYMKMANEMMPTTNSSILDDDIVTKTSKFRPPMSFEQNIVPSGILEAYVTMVLHEEEDEVTLTCAYNFPAVVLTLGRSNWHILKSLLQYLCDDIDWKVRKTMALSINFLALILGKEIATRDLVPIYLGFFKDLDEVKIEAIRNFASFLKAIDKSKHEEILSNIGICLRCDSQTNWRIKEDLAKEVCLVIKMYDSMQNCDILLNLTSLSGYFLEDKVSCVREIAADAMAEIIRISNSKFKEAIVKYFLVDEFANSNRWRNRQTFLNVLYKYNMIKMSPVLCSKNILTKVPVKSSDSPQQLSKSSSTASASSDSTSLDSLKDVTDILHLVFPSIEKLSIDFVPNIRLLVAKYLVLLINVNAISDDLHERFLKIVRRLRHDEDCDVRETFDSVDLLKDELDEQQILQQNEKLEEINKTTTLVTETPTYSAILKSNLDNVNDPEKTNIEKVKENKENSKLKVEADSNADKTDASSGQQLSSTTNIKMFSTILKTYLENKQKQEENEEDQEPQLQPQSVESNNETDEIVKLPDAIVSQSQI